MTMVTTITKILILIVVLSSLGCDKSVNTSNNEEIIIDSDITGNTTWNSDRVYHISNSIRVLPNVRLSIEAGTTIIFNTISSKDDIILNVEGSIITSEYGDPIVFKNNDTDYDAYLKIDNNTQICKIYNCDFSYLSYAIKGFNCSVDIKKCNFSECDYAIKIDKILLVNIANCLFSNNIMDISLHQSQSADSIWTISDNRFENASKVSIDIENDVSAEIYNNHISGCKIGVSLGFSVDITLHHNLIEKCDTGMQLGSIYGTSNIVLRKNTIKNCTESCLALYFAIYPDINFNNLLNLYGRPILHLAELNRYDDPLDIELRNNYWGTTSLSTINSQILDERRYKNTNGQTSSLIIEPIENSEIIDAYPSIDY